MEPLTQQEWDVLASIRAKNYATVVSNLEKIRNATPNRIQDALVEAGWEIIEALNYEDNKVSSLQMPVQERGLANRSMRI